MAALSQEVSLKLKKKKIKKDLKHVSLFTGCGGMDMGLEGGFSVFKESVADSLALDWVEGLVERHKYLLRPTRFKTVFANDIRPLAKKVYTNHFSLDESAYHVESIVELVKRHWNGEKVFPEGADVVTGGFPCQDFSLSGKRKGFNSSKSHSGKKIDDPTEENRGMLYVWMREVIDIVRPMVFIAENVKGLMSLGDTRSIIQKDFEDIGDDGYFVLQPRVFHSADFGVPQSRERVFFIGLNKSFLKKGVLSKLEDEKWVKRNLLPEPTHSMDTKDNSSKKQYVSLQKIFRGLPKPENSNDPSHTNYSKCKFYGKHCQGNREVDLKKIGPTIRSEHHGNIEFRRLSPENGGSNSVEFKKGFTERRLTPRECARIQTFPDDFELVIPKKVSASEAYKLVGNAVPPLLAYHFATCLERNWNKVFKKSSR